MVILPLLQQQYWTILYCSQFSYLSSNLSLCLNFCINFVEWFMTSFLYCFPYSYRSSNYCDSNSCRSFTLLKALSLFQLLQKQQFQVFLALLGESYIFLLLFPFKSDIHRMITFTIAIKKEIPLRNIYVLLPIQLSLFQLLQKQQFSLFLALICEKLFCHFSPFRMTQIESQLLLLQYRKKYHREIYALLPIKLSLFQLLQKQQFQVFLAL